MTLKGLYQSVLRKFYSIAASLRSRKTPKFEEFDVQSAIHAVCSADDVSDAFEIFKDNLEILRDWRILYACTDDRGSFKIGRRSFGAKGIVSTAMRGRSLIVLDKEFATSSAPIGYQIGYGVYADSNVATFIMKASYGVSNSKDLPAFISGIREVLPLQDLKTLNPFYYLWECQRSWDAKTHAACRENLAAIIAMHDDDDPLGEGWSERFLSRHREKSELAADKMIAAFLTDALAEETASRLLLIEAMIVRTKLIDGASTKPAAHKLVELIKFMCEELHTVMVRELRICSDILFKGKTGLTKKLNSIETKKKAHAVLQGCVWDVFMLRIMDDMATPKGLPLAAAYIPTLVSMDGDVTDIIQMTELRALALCRKTGRAFPFLDVQLEDWLIERIGMKRAQELRPLFEQGGFEARAKNRSLERVKEIALRDRNRLLPAQSPASHAG
ncbi:hypothetical protein C9I50_21230 [Pseudomonas prosekii]|uniref:hypothetical protein n=1 Tax=Pseudomonas prosekii TaxID=1148509 RepID=UPI000D6070C8|nr:hypothetical protein [Pseudomonas prosekii]PWE38762.1 hypothetical protein C9I50_21230 [Pseudomonas prosekii]